MSAGKKPSFTRQNKHKKRVKAGWKHPRGIDSKQQKHIKGKGAHPRIGYGTPREERGKERSGLVKIVVRNVTDLDKVNAKENLVVISATVGKKKKAEIVAQAEKLKARVSNN